MMRNQALLPVIGALNQAFNISNIHRLVEDREDFAPGESLARALSKILCDFPPEVREIFEVYITRLPGAIQETIRSSVYLALSSTPVTLVSFGWAPGYDYEINLWHIVEPKTQHSGISILLKSRYPDDPHPQVT
jgi:hypothetical protein